MTNPKLLPCRKETDWYYSFDRISGLRFCDTMSREQFNQMEINRAKELEEKYGKFKR